MSDTKQKSASKWPILETSWMSIAILIFSLAFVAESLTLKGDAGKYPLVVGLITAALCVLDLAARCLSRHAQSDDGIGILADRLSDKLLICSWIAATLVCFYVLGVIATVAVSGTVYFRLFVTGNSLKAMLIGLTHALAFWVAFDLLAGFNLYTGIVF